MSNGRTRSRSTRSNATRSTQASAAKVVAAPEQQTPDPEQDAPRPVATEPATLEAMPSEESVELETAPSQPDVSSDESATNAQPPSDAPEQDVPEQDVSEQDAQEHAGPSGDVCEPAASAEPAPLSESADMPNTPAIQIEQAVAEAKETLDNAVKATQDAAIKNVEQVVAEAKEQLQVAAKAQDVVFKSYADASTDSKCSLDALTNANTVLSQGVQDICKTVLSLLQSNIEDGLSASKRIINAKTPQEAMETYGQFWQEQLDRWMQESAHLSDLTMKLAEQAVSPLNECLNTSFSRLTKKG